MSRRFWTPVEDAQLRKLAGVKTAEEIAMILGRTKSGVHHRVKLLKLNGRLHGEHHWNAKISNVKAAMIGALYDAGFTVNEIATVMGEKVCTVCDITSGRTR
jgi:predicted transcriptional regulator